MAVERDVREKGDTMGLFVKGLRATGPKGSNPQRILFYSIQGLPLYFQERSPETHCVANCMDQAAGLDVVANSKNSSARRKLQPNIQHLALA